MGYFGGPSRSKHEFYLQFFELIKKMSIALPKVSVVLPAYNAALFIQQTIASITAQSYVDFEIIVVDDGSIDATSEIAAAQDPRVRVVRQHNQGIAVARNVGIADARGEWIAFMDHDDLWHPQKLQAQCAVLADDPACGIVFGEFLRWDPLTRPNFPDDEIDSTRVVAELSGFILPQLVRTNWVLLSTAMIRRSVFETVGLFDPAMPPADDWDLVIRAAEHYRFVKLAQAVALYRVHRGQTSLKLTPRNVEFELRAKALDRANALGSAGLDMDDINQRQFRALFNYGYLQYRAGLYSEARATFSTSLRFRAMSGKALAYVVASFIKSVLSAAR